LQYLLSSLRARGIACSREKAIQVATLLRDRVTYPQDLWTMGQYLFEQPAVFDSSVASKRWNQDIVRVLEVYREQLLLAESLSAESGKQLLEKVTGELNIQVGKILQAFRLAITGVGGGPDLMMIMEILGKEEVIARIDHALRTLTVKNP
jgi:glutamyl-tRNA synthetase